MTRHAEHVVPVNDLREHIVSDTDPCPCMPRTEWGDGGVKVIVHNSYDGRELREKSATAEMAMEIVESMRRFRNLLEDEADCEIDKSWLLQEMDKWMPFLKRTLP